MNKLKKEFYKEFVKDLGPNIEPVFIDPVGSVGPIWQWIESTISQTKKEAYEKGKKVTHSTDPDYCCACDYDLSVFESKIKKEYIKGYKKALRNVAGWNKEYEEMMIRNEVKKILDGI